MGPRQRRMCTAGAVVLAWLGTASGGVLPGTQAARAERPPAASHQHAPAAAKSDTPPPAVQPYLGTWLFSEVEHASGSDTSSPVDRYLLIQWWKGELHVKTYNYLPDFHAKGDESDWKGNILVDRYNTIKQTFNLRPDGTISLGLSGTTGLARKNAANFWWASGTLTALTDKDGPVLHYVTTEGYAPSSKGNAWRPLDRTYRLVSREVESSLLPPNHR